MGELPTTCTALLFNTFLNLIKYNPLQSFSTRNDPTRSLFMDMWTFLI